MNNSVPPPPCDEIVFDGGEVVFVTSLIRPKDMEAWVRRVAKRSGQRVDWHRFGPNNVILAVGNLGRVRNAIRHLMPQHDRLYCDMFRKCGGNSTLPDMIIAPPRPEWWYGVKSKSGGC